MGRSRDKKISPNQIARILKPFGIKSKQIRTETTGGKQKRGYRSSDFKSIFARYLQNAVTPSQNDDNSLQDKEIGENTETSQNVTCDTSKRHTSHCRHTIKSSDTESYSDVTDETAISGGDGGNVFNDDIPF